MKLLEANIYRRPFQAKSVSSQLSDDAWKKLGFTSPPSLEDASLWVAHVSIDNEALEPVQIRLQTLRDGQLHPPTLLTFPDATPTAWRYLGLTPAERKMPHDLLILERPLQTIDFSDTLNMLGFHSDLGADNARRFMTIEDGETLTYGLDVPCDSVNKYTRGRKTDKIRVLTRATEFCRVPALQFFYRKPHANQF